MDEVKIFVCEWIAGGVQGLVFAKTHSEASSKFRFGLKKVYGSTPIGVLNISAFGAVPGTDEVLIDGRIVKLTMTLKE